MRTPHSWILGNEGSGRQAHRAHGMYSNTYKIDSAISLVHLAYQSEKAGPCCVQYPRARYLALSKHLTFKNWRDGSNFKRRSRFVLDMQRHKCVH